MFHGVIGSGAGRRFGAKCCITVSILNLLARYRDWDVPETNLGEGCLDARGLDDIIAGASSLHGEAWDRTKKRSTCTWSTRLQGPKPVSLEPEFLKRVQ